jgi:hypothetical protein
MIMPYVCKKNMCVKSLDWCETMMTLYKQRRCLEQVAEGVEEQVEEGAGVQVGEALHLVGEERLVRAGAEQRAQHLVRHLLQ